MVSKVRIKYENVEKSKMFKKFLKELDKINNKDDWYDFIVCVMGTTETLYTKESTKYEYLQQFLNIRDDTEALNACKASIKRQLDTIIYELKTIGLPNKLNEDKTVVHNLFSPSVSQTNNINLVISTIENHLPPATMNEVKEILASEEKPEKKKNKIFEVVKSTGENILAKTISELMMKAFTGQ